MPSSKQIASAGIVLMFVVQAVVAQNYHFSNGWHPGKRNYGPTPCGFSQQVRAVIFKMIEEEVNRMIQCTRPNFNDIIGIMEDKGENNGPAVIGSRK